MTLCCTANATSAAATFSKTKDWPAVIKDDKMAIPSKDGKSIDCVPCMGKGSNKGTVNMRHPYALGKWNDHCSGKKHQQAVLNITAENEKNNPMRGKKQPPMVMYFNPSKKKKDYFNPAKEKKNKNQEGGCDNPAAKEGLSITSTDKEAGTGAGTVRASVVVDLSTTAREDAIE